MQEILKSTLLEFDKSTFLIDVIKFHSGEKYITIQQTITGKEDRQVLKINPSILQDIIFVLQMYKKDLDSLNSNDIKNYFSEEKQQKIVAVYLKGLSIKEVALQFNCSPEIIELILFNKGIAIVDQRSGVYRKKFRRSRPRRN